MKRLSTPIKSRLENPIDAAGLARIKAGVAARERTRSPRYGRKALPLAAIAAAAILLGLGAWWSRPSPIIPTPLTSHGEALVALRAEANRRVDFDDGSYIELDAGARLTPVINDGRILLWTLEGGEVEFEVRPGSGRRWLIEVGGVTVEVVGTHFVVRRGASVVHVEVSRGHVVVRGASVPGAAQHLLAGQHLDVAARGAEPVAPSAPVPASAEVSDSQSPDRGALAPVDVISDALDSERESSSESSEPVGTPPRSTAPAARSGGLNDPVAHFLERVDAARSARQPRIAARELERVVRLYPRDPRAGQAAFALARLELDVLDEPRSAAAALEQALSLGLPRALREDARARLVEAHARSGRLDAARAAMLRFQMNYPESNRLSEVRRWGEALGAH